MGGGDGGLHVFISMIKPYLGYKTFSEFSEFFMITVHHTSCQMNIKSTQQDASWLRNNAATAENQQKLLTQKTWKFPADD